MQIDGHESKPIDHLHILDFCYNFVNRKVVPIAITHIEFQNV